MFAALAVMLYTSAAFAVVNPEHCADWYGTWVFNYGDPNNNIDTPGTDNETIYISTVCDNGLGCTKFLVFDCYATGVRKSDLQPILLGWANIVPVPPQLPSTTTWGYYENSQDELTTLGATAKYDRIATGSYTGTYFDNVTDPITGNGAPPPPLKSGLKFGRRITTDVLQPGTCKDWLGRWKLKYRNILTTGDLTDNVTDNITITSVCYDNTTTGACKTLFPDLSDNNTWYCLAKGKSDNASKPQHILFGKQTGINFYQYFETYTPSMAFMAEDPFAAIPDSGFFLLEFTADLISATYAPNFAPADQTVAPTYLLSGTKITTTTTSIAGKGTCKDWVGTWTFTYDNNSDTIPGDASGKGRNGDYEVKICKFTENFVFPILPDKPFPCVAEGVRTEDSQGVFIFLSPFGPNTYYYEFDSLPAGQISGGAVITPANYSGTDFTADANSFGLKKGTKTDINSNCVCIDKDGDGYGLGCDNGTDCDDNDPTKHAPGDCDNNTKPIPCDITVVPSQVSKAFSFILPIGVFIISGAQDALVITTRPMYIDWGTPAITTLWRIPIGDRILFGFFFINPFVVEPAVYTVTLTYGTDGVCEGKLTVAN